MITVVIPDVANEFIGMHSFSAKSQKAEESYAHRLLPRRPQSSPALPLHRGEPKVTSEKNCKLESADTETCSGNQDFGWDSTPPQICPEYISAKNRLFRLNYTVSSRNATITQHKPQHVNVCSDRSLHSISGSSSYSKEGTSASFQTIKTQHKMAVKKKNLPTQFPVYKRNEKACSSSSSETTRLFRLQTEQAIGHGKKDAIALETVIAIAGSDLRAGQNRFMKNMAESKMLMRRRNAAMLEAFHDDSLGEKHCDVMELFGNFVNSESIASEATSIDTRNLSTQITSTDHSEVSTRNEVMPREIFYAALASVDAEADAAAAEDERRRREDASRLAAFKKKKAPIAKRKEFDDLFRRKAEILTAATSAALFEARGFEATEEYDVELDEDVNLRVVRMVNSHNDAHPMTTSGSRK